MTSKKLIFALGGIVLVLTVFFSGLFIASGRLQPAASEGNRSEAPLENEAVMTSSQHETTTEEITTEETTAFQVEVPRVDTFNQRNPAYVYRAPEQISYHSEVTNTERTARVLLPSDYDPEKTYPVLYLLHGLNGSYRTWTNKGADIILQNMYSEHIATEMIVVCLDSNIRAEAYTEENKFKEMIAAYDLTGVELTKSLMPYINSHYPVKTGKENTALAGYSMGGRNAIAVAFTHQELFQYVGAFAPENVIAEMGIDTEYTPVVDSIALDKQSGGFGLFLIVVGRQDDDCGYVSYALRTYLDGKKIPYSFYDMDGGHEDVVWQNALYNFALRIFQ